MEERLLLVTRAMDGRSSARSDEMLLALVVWLCSLPLVGLVVIPWLGWQIALMAAVALLIVALLACSGASGAHGREWRNGRKNKP